jgi:hypothetical protein
MLTLSLPQTDEHDAVELALEHSLVSLSKWESIHEKPFYGRESMTPEEAFSYFETMLLVPPPHDGWIERLTQEHFTQINAYINSKQSATWFREDPNQRGPKEIVTNELIYFWMISFNIPFDPCETWHVNRLMTLIKICGIKQQKPKKMTRQQQAEEYRRLNAERRAKLGTSG